MNNQFLQPIIDSQVVVNNTNTLTFNTVDWIAVTEEPIINVYVNGVPYVNSYTRNQGTFTFSSQLSAKDVVVLKIITDLEPDQAYYEIPVGLEKNPFKYDEFENIRRAYQRDLVAKQMARITRSQNQAKLDKEVAADCFLRIHKAISDLEGWGPGLKLSSREGEWSVVGISKNSGASLSSIRLNDKLVTVDGNAVSGLTFDGVRAVLLGPKDSKVVVVVSTKQFLFRVHREHVLIRSLPSASINFSSQEVVQKTLMNAQFVVKSRFLD
jgi:C-terminal processing protease CtpA/Prc